MRLEGSTILVTGANGFVGTHVCRRLARAGAQVRALVRRPGETPDLQREGIHEHGGAFTDAADAAVAVDGSDAVVHCAAALGADLDAARAVNRDGTATIVSAAAPAASVQRLVHVSTCAVYADPRPDVVDESAPLTSDEESPYAVTKAEAEQVARERAADTSLVILRPPVILGVGDTSVWGTKVPPRIRDAGWRLTGSDGGTFAWVHVDDLAEAVAASLTAAAAQGGTYNVVGGHERWRDYAERVGSWFDDAGPVEVTDDPAWHGRYATDAIEADLGWSPSVGFDEAMAQIERSWGPADRDAG